MTNHPRFHLMVPAMCFHLANSWRHGVVGRVLDFNRGSPEYEPRSHSKDFIFECGLSVDALRVQDHLLAYPDLMGTTKV